MINRLGWKTDISEDDSDRSIQILTDADLVELDDFFISINRRSHYR